MSEPDDQRPNDDFEEFVAAALRVDPKGLSGKHRRDPDDRPEPDVSEADEGDR